MVPCMQIPEGYERVRSGAADILVRSDYRDRLLAQGIARPDLLLQAGLTGNDRRRGRGRIGVVPLAGEPGTRMIIRQCLRGGLVRWVNRDRYLSGSRPFEELRVNAQAAAAGIPTARVLAAVALRTRSGLCRSYLIVQELDGCADLPAYLSAARQRDPAGFFETKRRLLRVLALLIRRMHDQGIHHGDLNMKIILVDTRHPDRLFLIDWDKSRVVSRLSAAARRANTLRLCRSIVKQGRLGVPVGARDAAYFLRAYSDNPRQVRRDLVRLRFSTGLRALFWKRSPAS